MTAPARLGSKALEKIWGTAATEPWYPSSGRKIGEIWFQGQDGAPLPLLVKFIFTSDRLSVQVHPDDAYARAHENSAGKTEMWYILRAEPGATIACGLKERVSPERLREASLSGEIEGMLYWMPVQPGDVVFMPAGSIHAIGAGIVLCEIQQQSDVTYRLYDYGRPRPLHLDKAMAVCDPGPHPGKSTPVALGAGEWRLAACPYFVTDLLGFADPRTYAPDAGRMHVLIAMEGRGRWNGEPFHEGAAWQVPAGAAPFQIEPAGRVRLLRTYVP